MVRCSVAACPPWWPTHMPWMSYRCVAMLSIGNWWLNSTIIDFRGSVACWRDATVTIVAGQPQQPKLNVSLLLSSPAQVAVGARHAALTTRGGEVYTWGAGVGGNMGNGTSAGSNHPQQVRVAV